MKAKKCNVFREKNTKEHCMARVCTNNFKCDVYYCENQMVVVGYDLNHIKANPSMSRFAEYDSATQKAENYR